MGECQGCKQKTLLCVYTEMKVLRSHYDKILWIFTLEYAGYKLCLSFHLITINMTQKCMIHHPFIMLWFYDCSIGLSAFGCSLGPKSILLKPIIYFVYRLSGYEIKQRLFPCRVLHDLFFITETECLVHSTKSLCKYSSV
jgi:hypothetical protein